MIAWNVYLHGELIDSVFYNERCEGGAIITADDVKRDLIEHDGYDPDIRVAHPHRGDGRFIADL
jgi:hypothetical protein